MGNRPPAYLSGALSAIYGGVDVDISEDINTAMWDVIAWLQTAAQDSDADAAQDMRDLAAHLAQYAQPDGSAVII